MQANNPHFMLSVAYPQMRNYFGVISSFLYSFPYSILGVWSGVLSGKVSRKNMLGIACICWSATSIGVGMVPSFGFFVLMRLMLGAFESACNPASYALIADYFPPSYRSTANAIETSGSYVGGGLRGISVLLIKKYGWRTMYNTIGTIGVVFGFLAMLLIKEPPRGVYDMQAEIKGDDSIKSSDSKDGEKVSVFKELKESLSEVWTNPVVKWTTIGGMFRFFETFSHVYWMPSFIQQVYPAYKSQFGLYYALIVAGGGFIATIMGGLISDKYEKKNRMTKALVCLVGGIIAIPALSTCVLTTTNFWLSMSALAIKYLASENWMSPAITMMQATVEPKK